MGRPPNSKNKPKPAAVAEPRQELMIADDMPVKGDVTVIPPAPKVKSVLIDMSNRYGMEPAAFEATVRATCMKPDKNGRVPSKEEFAAFLLVAKEYGLNPLTKEIYAYSGKGGGIIPIVSVDGWVNLVNSHGQCNGFTFEMEHGDKGQLISCTCNMYRKDRAHPVSITEYLSECVRDTEPWKMKHRMLRHKAMIQAARYAFGFSGIYDEDEGQKIAEIETSRDAGPPRQIAPKPEPEPAKQEVLPPEVESAEEVQDGAPPPRQAKADPISSGPPRQAPKPQNDAPQPYRIPGNGLTAEQWADKYMDLLQTSPDAATLYAWVDANTKSFQLEGDAEGTSRTGPLLRVEKNMPSVYANIRKVTQRTLERLQDEQQKAAEKAAKKSAPTEADMFEGSQAATPANPETVLARIKAELDAVEDADQLQPTWDAVVEPMLKDLFPPDIDLAQSYFHEAEKRLGGE